VTKLAENMRLDLGGIAKGFAADGMLDILHQHKITCASVIAGGEIVLGDPPPDKEGWEVTLMTLDTESAITPAKITRANCAISTSGDLYQAVTIDGQRYSHIVDPSTGLGLTRRISATVIGPNVTLTDALATAFCVNPQLSYPDVETIIVTENEDGSATRLDHAE
jgi:thiamine biosynthesis lipoprotein